MTELEAIESLRERDQEEATIKLLDRQIEDASIRLRELEKQEEGLQAELDALEITMTEVDEENQRLSDEYVPPDLNDDNTGSFFDQLRTIESIEEHCNGKITGLKTVNNRLRTEIGTTQAKLKRYEAQLKDLETQFETIDADRRQRAGDIEQQIPKLQKLEEERRLLITACEDTRATIKKKAQNQSYTKEYAEDLLKQKKVLELEVRKKRTEIQALKNQERDANMREKARTKLRQRNATQTQSSMNWMSQRTSLIAKVKKAREELEQLNSRERSASRSMSRTAQIREESNCGDQEAKHALASEINELRSESSPFIATTIQTEMKVKEELEQKLKDFEKTSAEILEFQKTTMELLEIQKVNAYNEPRINILKKELDELRACLSK